MWSDAQLAELQSPMLVDEAKKQRADNAAAVEAVRAFGQEDGQCSPHYRHLPLSKPPLFSTNRQASSVRPPYQINL